MRSISGEPYVEYDFVDVDLLIVFLIALDRDLPCLFIVGESPHRV
jgi:hypothetical protein